MNDIKHPAYIDFYADLFEARYNSINDSLTMINMLF